MRIDEDNVAYNDIPVLARDTDMFYDAKIPFYFSAIQEMGGEHASALGIGIPELLASKGYTWVITRSRIVFHKPIRWRDTLYLETWPEQPFMLHCPRAVTGRNQNNEPIFEAMTLWAVLDVVRKRPVRPKEVMDDVKIPSDRNLLGKADIGKVRSFDDYDIIRTYPIYSPVPVYYDLDQNQHINNTVYLDWVMAAMDAEVLKTHNCVLFDVQWKVQTFPEDKIHVDTALVSDENGMTFAHRVVKNGDTAVFEATSRWEKKNQ